MSDLKNLLKNGFQLTDHSIRKNDLALVSLRIALKAFFSTYAKLRGRIRQVSPLVSSKQDLIDSHNLNYAECYAECIVHFQHFAELSCKQFLRNDHALLADVAAEQPNVLHSLLHGSKLTSEEETLVKSIEFSVALRRIINLVDKKKLKDHNTLAFFKRHKETLEELNILRNRVWHRGLHILDYCTLDKLVGKYILPFVIDVVSHPEYANQERTWKYKDLDCGIDPLEKIIDHFRNENYSLEKVCYLKEIGRAAYSDNVSWYVKPSNPLNYVFQVWKTKKHRAERIAKREAEEDYQSVVRCPVCGADSVIVYEEHDSDYDAEDNPVNFYSYVHAAQCELCSLSFDQELGNASVHNLTEIQDYFTTHSAPI